MNFSTYRFSLDLHKHQSQMSIAVYQYDTAVRLCISLTDGGIPYLIEDGCKAVFFGRRADNSPLSHNCMIEGNARIIYDFQISTAAITGITDCQIRLYGKDGNLVTAPRFIIVVEERAVREFEIELETDTLSAIDAIFTEENARVKAEIARDEAENGKKNELGELVADGRVQAEQKRVTAESNRFYAELDRVEAERNRADEEESRQALEAERMEAEQSRVDAETTRILDEYDRNKYETQRKNQEAERVASETARAEEENARVQAEIGRVNAEISREERFNNAISSISQVYKLGGVAQTFDDLPSNPTTGIVYSIESDFTLNGFKYNAGTNVVYTENGWDALGGIVDYRDITQWNLIITNPADLGKLSTASGNVLLNIREDTSVYAGQLFSVSRGITLLDFGFSDMSGMTFKGNSSTTVRNCRGMSVNFIGFGSVENCTELVKVTNCNSVRDCDLREAVNCANMQNCYVQLDYLGTIISYCKNISDLIVRAREQSGEDFGAIEFSNCDHITNVHCESEYANQIHYNDCEFVDPYTCAGYVQPENSGKVPVPDFLGGVEFKEFVEQIPNNSASYTAVYARYKNNGAQGMINATSAAIPQAIPLRAANGQLIAPNQSISPPDNDDQYVSKRFTDEHYVSIVPNSTSYSKAYMQLPEKDGGGIGFTNMSTGAISKALALRKSTGQLAAPKYDPTKTDTVPGEDEYISRRYLEANAPSGGGGSKLYRHSISVYDYQGGVWCYSLYLTLFSTHSTPYTSWSQLPLNTSESVPCGGYYDPHDTGEAMFPVTYYKHNADGGILVYFFPSYTYGDKDQLEGSFAEHAVYYFGNGEDFRFSDTVTEVV